VATTVAVVPLHHLPFGKRHDTFVLLSEKTRGQTRDGKPFYSLTLKNRFRTVSAVIWADGDLYPVCDRDWQPGAFLRVRGILFEHDRYGLQIEMEAAREVINAKDNPDGFQASDFVERSRFDSLAMWEELTGLVTTEIENEPVRVLVLKLLTDHKARLCELPGSPRHYFPFPGGLLEHTLNVFRHSLVLVEAYRKIYPDMKPPLNRDLVAAGAALHELGRVLELASPLPGHVALKTIEGQLTGHLILARDMVRDAARDIPELNADFIKLLEHLLLSYLSLPEWGSPRLPAIPEALILHHADDLDAKMEMFTRVLLKDASAGPFTERDPVLGRELWKNRGV
jgi:3'-5' exoribonuclease